MSYLSSASGDPNFLGYFATPEALELAFPVGFPGAWAIVGSTDTIWIWDEDSMTWVDSGTGGGGVNFETPSGVIDGVNDTFTVLNTPKAILINGLTYFENDGYTLSGLTITIASPIIPATGSTLRSMY